MTALVPHTRVRIRFPGRRLVSAVPIAAVIIAFAADACSVALVKVSVPDDAADAARAGVGAMQFQHEATPQNAEGAFKAADEVARSHGLAIDTQTFTFFADGSVMLTAHRTAPTFLFKRLPWLRDHTAVTSTVTVNRANW